MQVLVRSSQNTFSVTVDENATLNDLKLAIENVEFIPPRFMSLVKGYSVLESESLEGLIEDGDIIELNLAVDGGMRAKWRKKRMRRLRRKRRKMRMRAR
eukprot:gene17195-22715_t